MSTQSRADSATVCQGSSQSVLRHHKGKRTRENQIHDIFNLRSQLFDQRGKIKLELSKLTFFA